MKKTLLQYLLFSIISFSAWAGVSNAQSILDRTITLSVNGEKIASLLPIIQKQANVGFLYSPDAIDLTEKVTFKGTNVKLKDFFSTAFLPLHIGFREVNGKILLYSLNRDSAADRRLAGVEADDRVITGTVLGDDGSPLVDASVSIRGTAIGTRTDASGKFSLRVPDGDVELEISYIGFTTRVVTVTGNTVTVKLESNIKIGEEVVVTALGISRTAKRIGYATSKVGGEVLNKAKEPNVAYSLQGRVPGLNISGVNSGPGASARILIRGISNFTSTTGPLFVIDGVPMDNTQKGSAGVYGGQDMGDGISSINPDDIEDITVLKGSTASALYGVRAANGVIQITTKSGKGQRGVGVEYNGNFSVNSIIDNTDYQLVYGHGINGQRPTTAGELTAAALNSWGERLDGQPALGHDGKMHPYSAVKNRKQGYYRVAPVMTNTVSVVNGGDKGNFRFSLSHMDNQSVLPKSGLTRYTANLNLMQNITNKLRLMLMVNYVDEKVKQRPSLNDMSRNANFTMNLLPVNIDPDYLKPGYDPLTGYETAMNGDGYMPNPWFVAEKTVTNTWRKRLISSVALRYDFTKELYLQARGGYDYINDNVLKIEPYGIAYNRRGQLEEDSRTQVLEMNGDILAGISRKLSEDFRIDATAGGSIRKYQSNYVGVAGSEWKIPDLYTSSNLVSLRVLNKPPGFAQTNSGYYTADFSFRNFLTLSTTGRYDEFSTLPGTSIFTPSVSASFIFSDLLEMPALNYGKLRVAYAETSGEAEMYKTSVYYILEDGQNDSRTFGRMVDEVVPKALKPYRMKEFEAGIELKGLENRLGLDVTWFNRRTHGELIRKLTTIASGYNFSYEKLGATRNSGVEIMLTGTVIRNGKFSWTASLNHTEVRNELVSIDGTADPAPIQKDGEGQYRPSVGPYSNGARVASMQGLPIAQILAYDYKYDAAGNIVVGADGIPLRGLLTPMGSGLPKSYGGFNNDFTYGNFNLSFLIDYKFGNKVLSGTDFLTMYYGLNKKTLPGRETGIVVDGVTENGKKNSVLVNAQDYYKGLVTNVTTSTVYNGSFIKFRQVTLGYNLPASLLGRSPFQAVSVSLVARNLFTLLKYTENFDPEDTFSSLPGNAGLEGGGLPQTRTYGINLNVKFKK